MLRPRGLTAQYFADTIRAHRSVLKISSYTLSLHQGFKALSEPATHQYTKKIKRDG